MIVRVGEGSCRPGGPGSTPAVSGGATAADAAASAGTIAEVGDHGAPVGALSPPAAGPGADRRDDQEQDRENQLVQGVAAFKRGDVAGRRRGWAALSDDQLTATLVKVPVWSQGRPVPESAARSAATNQDVEGAEQDQADPGCGVPPGCPPPGRALLSCPPPRAPWRAGLPSAGSPCARARGRRARRVLRFDRPGWC